MPPTASQKLLGIITQRTVRNLTVATFASFGLFKEEAYDANLWAGKILSDQGVAVAYKSVSPVRSRRFYQRLTLPMGSRA